MKTSNHEQRKSKLDKHLAACAETPGPTPDHLIIERCEILAEFSCFFKNNMLAGFMDRIVEAFSTDISVGKINDTKDPQDILDQYDALKELDQKLSEGVLHHIFEMESNHDDDSHAAYQMWFATSDLRKEWQDQWDNRSESETKHRRYIPIELFFAGEFLKKYHNDPRLVELSSLPY